MLRARDAHRLLPCCCGLTVAAQCSTSATLRNASLPWVLRTTGMTVALMTHAVRVPPVFACVPAAPIDVTVPRAPMHRSVTSPSGSRVRRRAAARRGCAAATPRLRLGRGTCIVRAPGCIRWVVRTHQAHQPSQNIAAQRKELAHGCRAQMAAASNSSVDAVLLSLPRTCGAARVAHCAGIGTRPG